MQRSLRIDAARLTKEDYELIHRHREVKGGAAMLAKKYKMSSARVYKIWRGEETPPTPIVLNSFSHSAAITSVPTAKREKTHAPRRRKEGGSSRAEDASESDELLRRLDGLLANGKAARQRAQA